MSAPLIVIAAAAGEADPSGAWVGLLWLVILLAFNAFFVGAEFAVVAARRSQIEPLADAGIRGARAALWAMENATLMLAMSQLGITVCSLLILNVAEPAIHQLITAPLGLAGWSEGVVSAVSFAIALILVTYLHVVLGEMVPKNISFSVPDRAVLLLAPPLVFISRIFGPLIWLLNGIANGILRLVRVEPVSEATSTFTLEQVASIVSHSKNEGVLSDSSGALGAAFEFTAKKVRDVSIALSGLVTLPPGATPSDVERAVAQFGFSRYLLVDTAGSPTGYVHLKDVIDLDEDEFDDPLPAKRVRRLSSIWEGTDLEDALASMRRNGSHIARVFDSAGDTTGVLFLEDIFEELVGEVRDATRR